MKTTIILILLSIGANVCAHPSSKGWHGLIPLHSNRKDVEKLLGPPAKGNIDSHLLEGISVFFTYSGGKCKEGWDIEKGAILNITVIPYDRPKLSNLALDLNLFSVERYGHLPDVIYYVNKKDGIAYKVVDDLVVEIIYSPSAADEQLKCTVKSNKVIKREGRRNTKKYYSGFQVPATRVVSLRGRRPTVWSVSRCGERDRYRGETCEDAGAPIQKPL